MRRRRRGGGGLSIHVKDDYKNYRAGGEREARVRERRREKEDAAVVCCGERRVFFFPFVFEFVCSSREVWVGGETESACVAKRKRLNSNTTERYATHTHRQTSHSQSQTHSTHFCPGCQPITTCGSWPLPGMCPLPFASSTASKSGVPGRMCSCAVSRSSQKSFHATSSLLPRGSV